MIKMIDFRTEMGMYYSYFKTMVNAESLGDGVYKLYRNHVLQTLIKTGVYPTSNSFNLMHKYSVNH